MNPLIPNQFGGWYAPLMASALLVVAGWRATAAGLALGDGWLQPEHLATLDCDAPDESLHLESSNRPGNLYFPGESVDLTVSVAPSSGVVTSLVVEVVEVNSYESGLLDRRNELGTAFRPALIRVGVRGRKEFAVTPGFSPKATNRLELADLPVPLRFGTYAITAAAPEHRGRLVATVARVPRPPAGLGLAAPVFGPGSYLMEDVLDADAIRQRALALGRLGIGGVRLDLSWNEPEPTRYDWKLSDRLMDACQDAGLKALVTLSGHPEWSMPFGQPTPSVSRLYPDRTCLPRYREVFGLYVHRFCSRYWRGGQGALWALEHWNEPWEGLSIHGWGSDLNHYRALMEQMGRNARRVDPRIRTAAAGTIMNTETKFLTGPEPESGLRWLDVLTDHYVPPESCYGPLVAARWGKESMDTEAWVAANEVLLGQVMVQWLACGQARVTPWHASMAAFGVPGASMRFQMPAPVAAATAAFNALIGARRFEGLLFQSHLPLAFQFGDGSQAVVVLVGRLVPLGRAGPEGLLWPQWSRSEGGTLLVDNADGALEFFDLLGNPDYLGETMVQIPLDATIHFLRCPQGGAAEIRRRLEAAELSGGRPVEMIAHDLTTPLGAPGAQVTVTLHNLLNRDITGALAIEVEDPLKLEGPRREFSLGRGEKRDFQFPLQTVRAAEVNAYPVVCRFDSDAGAATWKEVLHDVVVRRARIEVDGKLEDWGRIPAVPLRKRGATEETPWRTFAAASQESTNDYLGELRLAWDERFLYVAARVQDPTPGPLHQRLETWDEEQYFRSAADDAVCELLRPFERLVSSLPEDPTDWTRSVSDPDWPTFQQCLATNAAAREAVASRAAQVYFQARAVRPDASFADASHVYRKVPWNERPYAGDTLQLGLDLLPGLEPHGMKSDAGRVPEGFHALPDTDYEFCAYACIDGGTEVWRSLAPGVPRSTRVPRQGRAPRDQGPVRGAACIVVRAGSMVTYELAVPWGEMAEWKPRVGESFGCVFRFNDDAGAPLTFGQGKSATRANSLSLQPYHEASPSCGVRWVLGR